MPEQNQLSLPEIREQLLRLAGTLGPLSEADGAGYLTSAIEHINMAAKYINLAANFSTPAQGPVQ